MRAALGAAILILGTGAAQAACPTYASVDNNPSAGVAQNYGATNTVVNLTTSVAGNLQLETTTGSLSVNNATQITPAGGIALAISSGTGGNVCYEDAANAQLTTGDDIGLDIGTFGAGTLTATVNANLISGGINETAVVLQTEDGDLTAVFNGATMTGGSAVFAGSDAGNIALSFNGGSYTASPLASSDAVEAATFDGGNIDIFVSGDTLIAGEISGLYLHTDNGGNITVTGSGDSTAGNGITSVADAAIYAVVQSGTGNITIGTASARIGDLTGADGIFAMTQSGSVSVFTAGSITTDSFGTGISAMSGGGNVTVDTAGDIESELAGIVANLDSAGAGDILVNTAAGTTISATRPGARAISVIRADFSLGGLANGTVTVVNAATLRAPSGASYGIFAEVCDCQLGVASVVNRGNIGDALLTGANTGIFAFATTSVSVEHLAGIINANTTGILVGGLTVGGASTVPVAVTVAAGAIVTADVGIEVDEPPGPGGAENPATIVIAGSVTGTSGDAVVLGPASTGNRVELHPTYFIDGLVDSPGDDTVALGGPGAGTFDLTLLGSQFTNFDTLEKSGTSTWTLAGTSGFGGDVNVLGGTLSLGTTGSLPSANVILIAGRLAGIGTIGSLDVSGTLAPGNSIGTINVVGTATFNVGSIYEVEVDPTASDLTTADAAVINGGTVAVVVLPGNYASTQQYTIVATTAGPPGVSGQFSNVTINTSFLTPSLSKDANNVYLTLRLNPAAGEIHASLLGAFVESDQLRIAALDRAGTESLTANASSFVAGDAAAGAEPKGLWGRLYGAGGTLLASGSAATLTHGEGGIFAGTDGMLGAFRLGFLAGYGQTRANVAARNSNASTHDLSAGLYGGGDIGMATIKFGAGYTHHLVSTTRTTGIAGVPDTFTASYAVGTAQAFAEADGRIDLGAQEIVPFAGIAALDSRHGAYSETGGAGAINVAAGSFGAIVTTVGVRLEHEFKIGDAGLATARASAAWRHVAAGDPAITGSFAGSPAFVVTGTAPLRDALTVSAELDLDLTSTWSLDLAYRGQFGAGGQTHSATATLAASF